MEKYLNIGEKEKSKELNDVWCMARITKNRQCAKKRYKEEEFCKLHSVKENLKNGRIDEPVPKKRNPKVGESMINMASNADTTKLIAEPIILDDGTEGFQCEIGRAHV